MIIHSTIASLRTRMSFSSWLEAVFRYGRDILPVKSEAIFAVLF